MLCCLSDPCEQEIRMVVSDFARVKDAVWPILFPVLAWAFR